MAQHDEIKEWMREHEEEVEKVQQRYNKLGELSLSELIEVADDEGVDVSGVKDGLIMRIVAAREGN